MHHTCMLFLNSETKQKLLICRKSSRSYATCIVVKMFRLTSCAASCIARMLVKLPVTNYDPAQMHHLMGANYQARIWRESLLQIQSDMDPLENGWTLDDDGGFSIKWMRCNPAPDEVRLKPWFWCLLNKKFRFQGDFN